MKTNNFINSAVMLATVLGGFGAQAGNLAGNLPVPRGPDIGPRAANCNIGPLPQTSKASEYNVHCNALTDIEKCLAVIKAQLTSDGVASPELHLKSRTEYCLQHFAEQLTLTE